MQPVNTAGTLLSTPTRSRSSADIQRKIVPAKRQVRHE